MLIRLKTLNILRSALNLKTGSSPCFGDRCVAVPVTLSTSVVLNFFRFTAHNYTSQVFALDNHNDFGKFAARLYTCIVLSAQLVHNNWSIDIFRLFPKSCAVLKTTWTSLNSTTHRTFVRETTGSSFSSKYYFVPYFRKINVMK